MEAIKNKIMNMDEIQLKKKGRAIQSILLGLLKLIILVGIAYIILGPVITMISGEQLRMVSNSFLFSFPNSALCRSDICTIRYPSRSAPSFSDSYVYVVITRCLFWNRQNGIKIMIISIRMIIFLCGIFFIFIYSRSQITAPIFYLSSLPCDTSCL